MAILELDGQVLNINPGGSLTGLPVINGGFLRVTGGTAVNTVLKGGTEVVVEGIADGVIFQDGGLFWRCTQPKWY